MRLIFNIEIKQEIMLFIINIVFHPEQIGYNQIDAISNEKTC